MSTEPCFCLKKGRSYAGMLIMSVMLFLISDKDQPQHQNMDQFEPTKNNACLEEYMLYRFFKLFIADTENIDHLNHNKPAIGHHLRRQVEYVNQNGGFDIYGWSRLGQHSGQQLSAPDEEAPSTSGGGASSRSGCNAILSNPTQVFSSSATLHICYLYPNKPDVISE